MRRERQRGGEELDVVSVGAGAETGVEHVVGAGHAFDDVAGEVGVRAVGGDVDCVVGFEGEEVHCSGLGGGGLAREQRLLHRMAEGGGGLGWAGDGYICIYIRATRVPGSSVEYCSCSRGRRSRM